MPFHIQVIQHPEARVLANTRMAKLHPVVADIDSRQDQNDFELAVIDIAINR